MDDARFDELLKLSRRITRDDLATHLCLTGWTPLNEAGREFVNETGDVIIVFRLGTCRHESCFVRDLLKFQEVCSFLDQPVRTIETIVSSVETSTREVTV